MGFMGHFQPNMGQNMGFMGIMGFMGFTGCVGSLPAPAYPNIIDQNRF